MKLCRFGTRGSERPGLVDSDGCIRDLSAHVADVNGSTLAPSVLERLSMLHPCELPRVPDGVRLGPPISGSGKFIGIGLNYRDHAEEAGLIAPLEPIVFLKATSCISGPNDPILKPAGSTKLDWEIELGVVIGTPASCVSREDAMKHVAGFSIVHDVSERGFQSLSSQWTLGKGCDSFGPIGPWLVTVDEIHSVMNLGMRLEVNGETKQRSNTRNMIFDVAEIVAFCSQYMRLEPGDIICTGTPGGVGMGERPEPRWLQVGDVVYLWIDGLGHQRQVVVDC
jgi:2-keto-4-pentenoate hydratase/2-oxohepta-3-ene-1,7-dioic acid hydratase in catechol pathway